MILFVCNDLIAASIEVHTLQQFIIKSPEAFTFSKGGGGYFEMYWPVVGEFAGSAYAGIGYEFGSVLGHQKVIEPRLSPVSPLQLVKCKLLVWISLPPYIREVVGGHACFNILSRNWIIHMEIPTCVHVQGYVEFSCHNTLLEILFIIDVKDILVEAYVFILIVSQECLLIVCE